MSEETLGACGYASQGGSDSDEVDTMFDFKFKRVGTNEWRRSARINKLPPIKYTA